MSALYTPTGGTFHPTLTVPSPGDGATARSVDDAALKYLADNDAYLKLAIDGVRKNQFFNPQFLDGDVTLTTGASGYVAIATSLLANRTWRIDDTGAQNGAWLYCANRSAGGTVTVLNPNGSLVGTIPQYGYLMVNRIEQNWVADSGSSDRRELLANTVRASVSLVTPDVYAERVHVGAMDVVEFIATGTALFRAGITVVGGDVTIQGVGGIDVAGDAYVGNNLEVTNQANLLGNASVGGTLEVGGDIQAGGGLMRKGFAANTANDSDQSIERNATTVCVPGGASPYTWTIFGANQQDGDWARVYCNSIGVCTLKDPAGNILALLSGGAGFTGVFVTRIASVWYVAASG